MRERQRLDEGLSAVRKLEAELADAQGLIEMAEAESDTAPVRRQAGRVGPHQRMAFQS